MGKRKELEPVPVMEQRKEAYPLDDIVSNVELKDQLNKETEILREMLHCLEYAKSQLYFATEKEEAAAEKFKKMIRIYEAAVEVANRIPGAMEQAAKRIAGHPVEVSLEDKSMEQVAERHRLLMKREENMLNAHTVSMEQQMREHFIRMANLMANSKGIWVSLKTFYTVGSISIFSICAVILEIVLWIYYNWIL